ncbi:MAG: hypothetical protein ACTSU0_06890 [Alphaproteobacteria bacterium]
MPIRQIFTGDASQLEREMAGLHKKNTKLIEDNRKLAAGSKKAGQASKNATTTATGGARQLAQAIGGSAGVVAAVKLATTAYHDWQQKIIAAGTASTKFHGDVIKDLSEGGDLAQGGEVIPFLENMKGVTRADAGKAYAGVTGAAPDLSLDRRKELTKATARLGVTGQDVQAFGDLTGELAEVLTEKTADDLSDLALKLRQVAGKEIQTLTSKRFLKGVRVLEESGVGGETAFAYGMQAAKAGVSGDILAKIADVSTKQYKHKKGTSEAVGTFNQFADAAPKERLSMIHQDEGLRREVMGEQAVKFALIKEQEVAKLTESLRQAQQDDIVKQELANLEKFPAGAAQAVTYRKAAKIEKKKEPWELEGEAQKRYDDLKVEAGAGKAGVVRGLMRLDQATAEWAELINIVPSEKGHHERVGERVRLTPGAEDFVTTERRLREQRGVATVPESPIEEHVAQGRKSFKDAFPFLPATPMDPLFDLIEANKQVEEARKRKETGTTEQQPTGNQNVPFPRRTSAMVVPDPQARADQKRTATSTTRTVEVVQEQTADVVAALGRQTAILERVADGLDRRASPTPGATAARMAAHGEGVA